jgi:hypothetical protein
MNLEIKLFRIDEDELLQIWDNFSDIMIEDKEICSSDVLEFLENTMREIATGETIHITTNDTIAYLLEFFLKHFFHDEKSYKFVFQNIIAQGEVL